MGVQWPLTGDPPLLASFVNFESLMDQPSLINQALLIPGIQAIKCELCIGKLTNNEHLFYIFKYNCHRIHLYGTIYQIIQISEQF